MKEENITYSELIKMAQKAREFSYSPYSHYMVGAALLTKSGKVFTGCNIESVSYSPTTCAERVAILKAVSEGEREFSALAVIGGPSDNSEKKGNASAPCGVCRQMIYEFSQDIKIIIANSENDYYVKTIKELLPDAFGPEILK